MRRIAAAFALVFSVAAIAAGGAGSATSKSAFEVIVEPTISSASNGLTLETEFEGSFNVAAKTATGGGSYAVMAGATELEDGTFTLTGLVAFQFYGCGEVATPEGPLALPPDFCGGRAIVGFHAVSPRRPGASRDERRGQGECPRGQLQQARHGRQPLRDGAVA